MGGPPVAQCGRLFGRGGVKSFEGSLPSLLSFAPKCQPPPSPLSMAPNPFLLHPARAKWTHRTSKAYG